MNRHRRLFRAGEKIIQELRPDGNYYDMLGEDGRVWRTYVLPLHEPTARPPEHRIDTAKIDAELLSSVVVYVDAHRVTLVEQWKIPGGDVVQAVRSRLRHCLEGNGW